ncbi:MAG: hypothetical protein K1X56_08400 [Flavobacteriales bacterium]|nr:hypothetical protein [Flavobacteriales bacterium]
MQKAILYLLLSFYSLGVFLLPKGDFSYLAELPEMYHHCKSQEDKDMTWVDFISDHLINFDGIFDAHNHGDEQKPHKGIEHKIVIPSVYIAQSNKVDGFISSLSLHWNTPEYRNLFHFEFIPKLLKPPSC